MYQSNSKVSESDNGARSTASDAIKKVVQKSRDKRSTLATAATAGGFETMTKLQLQALCDTVTQGIELPYRIMVTQREFGFLKKRFLENPPQHLPDMLRFCFTHWGTIAAQNRAANAKRTTFNGKKCLPEAPHFHTFAYWYPYFFRVYQNHLAAKLAPAKDIRDERMAKPRLQAPTAPPQRPAAPPKALPARFFAKPATSVSDEELFSDLRIPSWEEVNKGK